MGKVCRGQLKSDGTRAEIIPRLSAKRTSPFKSAGGRQFSRLLAAKVCASVVVMLDTSCSEVVWRVLATHSIRQFPLHFPSRAACAITFQLEPTGLLAGHKSLRCHRYIMGLIDSPLCRRYAGRAGNLSQCYVPVWTSDDTQTYLTWAPFFSG